MKTYRGCAVLGTVLSHQIGTAITMLPYAQYVMSDLKQKVSVLVTMKEFHWSFNTSGNIKCETAKQETADTIQWVTNPCFWDQSLFLSLYNNTVRKAPVVMCLNGRNQQLTLHRFPDSVHIRNRLSMSVFLWYVFKKLNECKIS